MRIAHFGNMANDAFPVVEALTAKGFSVELYIYRPCHVTALPHWELGTFPESTIGNLYDPNLEALDKLCPMPDWVHVLDLRGTPPFSKPQRALRIIREMRKFDFIVAHVPFPIYAQFSSRPFAAFDAGAIRYLSLPGLRMRLMRRAYRKAKCIVVTNPDTIFRYRFPNDCLEKVPFLIDTNRYSPRASHNYHDALNADFLVYCPARQYWVEKGNDILIRGFRKFMDGNPHISSRLFLAKWGNDLAKSEKLIQDLSLKNFVEWIPLSPKPKLIELYNAVDVVADQFILGSYGTACPEAMACEKPVVMHLERTYMLHFFGELAPILEARTPDQVAEKFSQCLDPAFRDRIGKESREWVLEHHAAEIVAKRHLEICERYAR